MLQIPTEELGMLQQRSADVLIEFPPTAAELKSLHLRSSRKVAQAK